jgi:GAF domain-containing protein
VLSAANSEGGQRMLARQHKLGVGTEGIVGYVTGTGEPRVALDVGADAVYFDNPDMPDTRSEMALPLRVGDEIIGALDVQSTQEAAFDEEDVSVLTALADQIATAIQNARLFQQSQAALEEAQRAQRRFVQQEWSQLTTAGTKTSHEYTLSGVPSLGNAPLREVEQVWLDGQLVIADSNGAHSPHDAEQETDPSSQTHTALAAPIKLRDEIIGVLDLQEIDVERVWTDDEIALVQAVADQLGQALEGARLFEQTQASLSETQTLFDTSRNLAAAQKMEEIWHAIIDAARGRGADACGLFLFDTMERANARQLVLTTAWDRLGTPRMPVGTDLPLDSFSMFDTLRPDSSFEIADLAHAKNLDDGIRQLLTDLGFEALLHQPIAVRDRWFGLLTVLYETPHAFAGAETGFYRTLADQAALAIEGQRLLAESRRRAEREQLIRHITDKVRATSSIESILQTTVQELSRAMGLPRAFIRLGTEEEFAAASKAQRLGDSNP